MRRTCVLVLVFLIVVGYTSPACALTPSAKIVGQWEGQWEPSEYISVVTEGKIDGKPYLFLVTTQGRSMLYEATLRVLDIRNPKTPMEVGSLKASVNVLFPILDLYLSETTLYTSLGGEEGGIWIVDVSDPASPQEIALMPTDYPATGLALSGQYLYVSSFFEGLISVIDVSDPEQPQEVGALKIRGDSLKISGSLLYLIADDGLHIIDISTPSSPQDVGFYADPTGVEGSPIVEEIPISGSIPVIELSDKWADRFFDVAVSGQYAYLATGNNGLHVLDISDPTSPKQLTQLDIPGITLGVLVSSKLVYLLSTDLVVGEPLGGVLSIIDVSDPSAPKILDSVDTAPTDPTSSFAKSGSTIFVVHPHYTLLVIKVSGI